MNLPIALQLYTLREEMKKDFLGTLERVAETGYKGVEFAGYGNLTSGELKTELDRLGLKAAGSHVSLELLKNNLEEIIQYNLEIGSSYIICPWSEVKDKNGITEIAGFLNETGRKCREAGVEFCYHNHAHEFIDIDGIYGLDYLYSLTDPQNVQAEIDTYWVKRAGVDPIGYLRKFTGRCPLVHIKDMEDSEEKFYTEIGCGTMDIKGIAETAGKIGTRWLVVEQDECRRPALESVKISFENLKQMGLA